MADSTVDWGNTDSKAEVVPFGKYKGQPVEVLLADKGYRDWLMQQDWFRDRFANIYQTVINYGGQPQDTPEHNEMQASFLNDELCFRLAKLLYPRTPFERDGKWSSLSRSEEWKNYGWWLLEQFDEHVVVHWEDPTVVDREFEAKGWDVVFDIRPASVQLQVVSLPECRCGPCSHDGCNPSATCRGGLGFEKRWHAHRHPDEYPYIDRALETLRKMREAGEVVSFEEIRGDDFYEGLQEVDCRHPSHKARETPSPETERWTWSQAQEHCDKACPWSREEVANWLLRDDDYRLKYTHSFEPSWIGTIRVECKPDLGDDFPAVLRQVTKYDRQWHDRCCVVVRRYSFEYVTWEQVEAMFAGSGITLIKEDQLVEETD